MAGNDPDCLRGFAIRPPHPHNPPPVNRPAHPKVPGAASFLALSLIAAVAAVAPLGGTGCASVQGNDAATPQDAARAAYETAEETFEGANYLEAIREFQEIKTKHPYSTYAPLAELRLGDCQFEMGKYLEAVEIYRAFVRFHPHHARVGYARFRIGESYVREMPEDWFFMPPAYEKDQAATRDAVRALDRFLEKHPDDEKVKEAKEMRTATRRRLADHEAYVANFYLKRDRPAAAAGRLEGLVTRYPDVGLAQDALLTLGAVYRDQLDEPAKAYNAFRRLIEMFPKDERAAVARRHLKSLPKPASPDAKPLPAPEKPPAPGAPAPTATDAQSES